MQHLANFDSLTGLWDAAVGIPACRPLPVVRTNKIQPVRNTNSWYAGYRDSLQRVGPLNQGLAPLRPVYPWVFDLTTMDDGWQLLEVAHVLAHLRGDDKLAWRRWATDMSQTAGHLVGALANVIVSQVFGLPLNIIKDPTAGLGKEGLDIATYGVDIRASGRFTFPVFRVPWCSNESPRPDCTRAYLHVAVYSQPVPHTYAMEGTDTSDFDRWGCTPTIVAIVGWEAVDYITHATLTAFNPADADQQILYTVHPADLLPPDTFWAFLAEGNARVGAPKYNPDFVDVQEWVAGKVRDRHGRTFLNLLAETPCLPCPACKTFNQTDPHRIVRPDGFMPRQKPKKGHPDKDWSPHILKHARLNECMKLASLRWLTKLLKSAVEAGRTWRQRRSAHRRKLLRILPELRLQYALRKDRRGKSLNKRERRLVDEHERMQRQGAT